MVTKVGQTAIEERFHRILLPGLLMVACGHTGALAVNAEGDDAVAYTTGATLTLCDANGMGCQMRKLDLEPVDMAWVAGELWFVDGSNAYRCDAVGGGCAVISLPDGFGDPVTIDAGTNARVFISSEAGELASCRGGSACRESDPSPDPCTSPGQ